MAEPALILFPASQAIAARATPAIAGRRPALLRCRVEPAPAQTAAETTQPAGEEAVDYTGFSMVGVAG